jgi:hypothetical protein
MTAGPFPVRHYGRVMLMKRPRRREGRIARLVASVVMVFVHLCGPFLPSLAARSETAMPCCKRGTSHSCCARKAKQGPVLRTAPECGKTCIGKPQIQPVIGLEGLERLARGEMVSTESTPMPAGTSRSRPTDLDSTLFQRPPPTPSPLAY